MDSINFTGAFLVKNPTKIAKEELNVLSCRRKQIFENFNNTSDVFYVVRPSREKNIAKFIIENNLNFKFFPLIGTKSGLDPIEPEKAIKMTKLDKYIIGTKYALAKKFGLLPEPVNYKLNIEGITKALGLKPENLSISTKNGVTFGFTKDGGHVFKSSPVNKYGDNYVYLNDSDGSTTKKLLVSGDRIVFEYPKNAKYFESNFDNALIPQVDKTV